MLFFGKKVLFSHDFMLFFAFFSCKIGVQGLYIVIVFDKFVKMDPAIIIVAVSSLKFFQPEKKSTLKELNLKRIKYKPVSAFMPHLLSNSWVNI